VIHNRSSTKIHRELVAALESVRTRLAVAIACETKSTTPDRRQYYLETADRMRRFTKNLRTGSGALQERQDWHGALDALRRIPAQTKAFQLCQTLRRLIGDPAAGSE
jgi:hypothetical protein